MERQLTPRRFASEGQKSQQQELFAQPSRFSSMLIVAFSLLIMGCSRPVVPPSAELTTHSQASTNAAQKLPITATATVAGRKINLEVARSPQEQATGLMYRDQVPDDRGMLFLFDPARPVGFWMRNVRIPLDMIFLENGQVKAIASAVPPCNTDPCPTYGPETPIDQVIELRGGRAAELGLKVGDRIDIQFLDLPRRN